jgi:succinate dehydrogenase / fumarate reductase cytochrome b subunit
MSETRKKSSSFFWRRLHSLTGIIPVGGFLVFHLYENWSARNGAEAFNETVRMINSLPFLPVLEIVGIFLPLYFHALYGLYILADADYKMMMAPGYFAFGRNLQFFLQRVTGIITLIFVTYHIWEFRVQKALGAYAAHGNLPTFDVVRDALSNNWIFAFYVLGIWAAAYHLGNGLYTFLITWGITVGPKAQRVSNWISNVVWVLVTALGIAAALSFRV